MTPLAYSEAATSAELYMRSITLLCAPEVYVDRDTVYKALKEHLPRVFEKIASLTDIESLSADKLLDFAGVDFLVSIRGVRMAIDVTTANHNGVIGKARKLAKRGDFLMAIGGFRPVVLVISDGNSVNRETMDEILEGLHKCMHPVYIHGEHNEVV